MLSKGSTTLNWDTSRASIGACHLALEAKATFHYLLSVFFIFDCEDLTLPIAKSRACDYDYDTMPESLSIFVAQKYKVFLCSFAASFIELDNEHDDFEQDVWGF